MVPSLFLALLLLTAIAFHYGRKRSHALAEEVGGLPQLHSRPFYYGTLTALWCGLPALVLASSWLAGESRIIIHLVLSGLPEKLQSLPAGELNLLLNDIKNLVSGNIVSQNVTTEIQAAANHYQSLINLSHGILTLTCLVLAIGGMLLTLKRLKPTTRARSQVEKVINLLLLGSSMIAIFTTIGIVLSILFEALRFFKAIPVTDFLFGLHWSPQMAIRADQVGSSGSFGAIPIFTGTAMIAGIAMMVAVPLGLMSAIYLSEYAHHRYAPLSNPCWRSWPASPR